MGKASKKINPSKIKHPESRKAQQFIRQKTKENSREKKKLASLIKLNSFGEKILWFKNNLDLEITEYSPNLVKKLIERYLNRFDEEMNVINSRKSYKALKNASRRDFINHIIYTERMEYNTCGIEVPDILNKSHLEELRKWNGELRFLQNLTVTRYSEKQLEPDDS